MAASATDKFRKGVAQWSGNIGSAGVADAVVKTVPLASTSGLPTDTAVMITVNRVDTNGKKTGNYEGIVGVVSGSNLIDCIRGVEGTAQAWTGGTVVEVLHTADNLNDLIDGILVEHGQDGTHDKTKVVDLTTAQTLTNKTLTSPKINEDVALTSTATELNALHNQTGAWTSYTVTPTNLTIGSGTLTGRYIKIGKLVIGRVRCVLAADSSISGAVEFSKPVTSVSASFPTVIGECVLLDSGTVEEMGRLLDSSTTKFKVQALTTPGTYVGVAELSATSPWTWAVNDVIDCKFIYEAA